ncbi:hypothetical protein Tco_1492397 [Tanacetum coccineum]
MCTGSAIHRRIALSYGGGGQSDLVHAWHSQWIPAIRRADRMRQSVYFRSWQKADHRDRDQDSRDLLKDLQSQSYHEEASSKFLRQGYDCSYCNMSVTYYGLFLAKQDCKIFCFV